MMKLKPTTAQVVALHTLESAGLTVLLTVFVGIGQFLTTNDLNFAALGGTAGALFVGSMSMVYKSLATNPQVQQGVADTVNEVRVAIQADIQRLAQSLSGGQPVPAPTLIQAPAQLDAVSVADTILQHLDLGQVAQGLAPQLASELMKIRVPSPQSMPAVQPQPQAPIAQRPTVQQPAYQTAQPSPQVPPTQSYKAG